MKVRITKNCVKLVIVTTLARAEKESRVCLILISSLSPSIWPLCGPCKRGGRVILFLPLSATLSPSMTMGLAKAIHGGGDGGCNRCSSNGFALRVVCLSLMGGWPGNRMDTGELTLVPLSPPSGEYQFPKHWEALNEINHRILYSQRDFTPSTRSTWKSMAVVDEKCDGLFWGR